MRGHPVPWLPGDLRWHWLRQHSSGMILVLSGRTVEGEGEGRERGRKRNGGRRREGEEREVRHRGKRGEMKEK